jgi:hypothetical protein
MTEGVFAAAVEDMLYKYSTEHVFDPVPTHSDGFVTCPIAMLPSAGEILSRDPRVPPVRALNP